MGTGYTRNDTSNNIADGNIINAADLDGEFDAIESAMGTSGHTHDGTSAEGGPVTVLGPVQDFVASATEIKPKTTNTLDIGTSGLLFKNMFLDGVATMGSIKIDNAGTIGSATTGDAITISSGGIVTFKDDIIIKDGGTIGSASDADAITISSGGVVTFSQAVSNLGNVTGKTGSGFVLSLQTSDTTIEATNVLGKIEFSAPNEASGTDAILVGASIEALAEDTFDSSTNSTALVFKTNTTGAATERMRLTSAGDLHFLDDRKAIFGAGSDLQIYHDGDNSYIDEAGVGALFIRGHSQVRITDTSSNIAAVFRGDAESTLYHNNAAKLATASTGVDITGELSLDTRITVNGGTGNGSIELGGDTGAFIDFKEPLNEDFNGRIIYNDANGFILGGNTGIPVKLAYGGVGPSNVKLATTSTGVDITGDLDASSNLKVNGTLLIDASMNLQNLNLVQVATGSSTAPSIRFTGDTNTGFARPASDTLGFITAGSEAMRIDSSGNLLVGKTTENTTTVGIQARADGLFAAVKSGAESAIFGRNTDDGDIVKFRKDGSTVGSIAASGGLLVIGDSDCGIAFEDGSTNHLYPWNVSGGAVNDGNINLGASFARYKDLYLSNSVKVITATNGTSIIDLGDTSDSDIGRIAYDNSVNEMYFKTNNSEAMRIDSSGNVGVGTSSPSSQLHIKDDVGNAITLESTVDNGNDAALKFKKARGGSGSLASIVAGDDLGTIEWYGYDGSTYNMAASIKADSTTATGDFNAKLIFSTGSEAMRIDGDGNVGIGTSSSGAKLEVKADDLGGTAGDSEESLRLTTSNVNVDKLVFTNERLSTGTTWTSAVQRIQRVVDASKMGYIQFGHPTSDLITFGENTVERMRIDGDGNVGIGTKSPAVRLSGTVLTIDDTSTSGLELTNSESQAGEMFSDASNTYISERRAGSLIFRTAGSNERMRIDSSGNVGIGTDSPDTALHVASSGSGTQLSVDRSTTLSSGAGAGTILLKGGNSSGANSINYAAINSVAEAATAGSEAGALVLSTLSSGTTSERMRIDSSGNLLVGTTDSLPVANNDASGIALRSDGNAQFSRGGAATARFNRGGSDGEIVSFNKDGSTVGSIGVNASELIVGTGDTGLKFTATFDSIHAFNISTNSNRDNAIDLGASTVRFDDIYATNGTIQTSDRNEKQDIAELTDAEQRVAVAAKGLLRKFRWKDAVTEKGDEARTHFGIIAQDLQAAFAAEGLDAGDYAMFISSTWTDEETGEERTRMGVRYSELLAFIIAAI